MKGHQGAVLSLVFERRGETLISGGEDETIRRWDIGARRESSSIKAGGQVWTLVLDSDRLLVTGSFRVQQDPVVFAIPAFAKRLRLRTLATNQYVVEGWDLAAQQRVAESAGHRYVVAAVDINADGSYLASGSLDRTIRIWSLQTGEQVRRLDGHEHYVVRLQFHPDGKRLLSAGYNDGTVRLWRVVTASESSGKLLSRIKRDVGLELDGTEVKLDPVPVKIQWKSGVLRGRRLGR